MSDSASFFNPHSTTILAVRKGGAIAMLLDRIDELEQELSVVSAAPANGSANPDQVEEEITT